MASKEKKEKKEKKSGEVPLRKSGRATAGVPAPVFTYDEGHIPTRQKKKQQGTQGTQGTQRKTQVRWYSSADTNVVRENILHELQKDPSLSRRLKELKKKGITGWQLREYLRLRNPLYNIPVNVLNHDPKKEKLLYEKKPPLLTQLREEAQAQAQTQAQAQGKKKSKKAKKAKKEKKPKTKAKKEKKAKTQKQRKR